MLRLLTALFVCCLCGVLVSQGIGEEKKAKKHAVKGKIVSVEAAKGSTDEGTLTIKTKKEDVKVEVKKTTKIEKAPAKKGDAPTPASFSDLKVDQTVSVTLGEGNVAERVVIHHKKKKD
jgi:hypothetical protein